ncbi:MAG: hypothetical protein JST22_21320 [Bacteroidetes bacterium]|nr:hypothetical protein [Bacteroidota bacterium]
MRIDVGDRLIGIGVTQIIEDLGRPPGLDTCRVFGVDKPAKMACRAFQVDTKTQTQAGFDFTFKPLSPQDYSDTLALVSNGAAQIPASSIPEGTIIVSFVTPAPRYTLENVDGSPAKNWGYVVEADRYWNVGIANEDDFWVASFPSDDIGMLAGVPSSARIGSIRFGLSLLSGPESAVGFSPMPCAGPSGTVTHHQFVLSGCASGTMGLNTAFPIGLRTEILFCPMI